MQAAAGADVETVRTAAVALLARRDLASPELHIRLAARGYPAETIDAALAQLREERLLDDVRYMQAQILARSERGQGPLRIKEHLLGAGLSASLVEAALAEGPEWRHLAEQVRRRRFGEGRPQGEAEAMRQARFLQYRGFTADHIRAATGADLDLD